MARVLVTGAASGLGQALADLYAARGDDVLATDLADVGDPAWLPVPRLGGSVAYLGLDVRDEAQWAAARDWVDREWGGLDLLVNNAGVAAAGRVDSLRPDDWRWLIDVNLMGVVNGCAAFTPGMKRAGRGHVVNVASMAGLVHPPAMASYNAVKAAVVALSETMLHELAPHGVGVTVVCPSFFRSQLHERLRSPDADLAAAGRSLIRHARLDAATVASRVVRDVDAGRYLVLTDREGRIAHHLKRLAPGVYRRYMAGAGRRLAQRTPAR